MIKRSLLLFLLILSYPTNTMENMGSMLHALVDSCDSTKDEQERGWLGQFLRFSQKRWGTLNWDLICLGSELERSRTLHYFQALEENPSDKALQTKCAERQASACNVAYDLIAQLEKFAEKCSSSPTLDMAQESPSVLHLIKISQALRRYHTNTTLAPGPNLRLIRATNTARRHLKRRFGLTDSTGGGVSGTESSQTELLREEPEVDQETIELVLTTIPDHTIMARAVTVLKQTLVARRQSSGGGAASAASAPAPTPTDLELISLALQLARPADVMQHARAIAHASGKELILKKKDHTEGGNP